MGSNYERGLVLYQTKQFKQAEKEFRQELTGNPNSAAAHAMLGMTLTALRKGDQGHKEALEAVRLLPQYSYAHYTLSFTFAALSCLKDAQKAITEAIRLEPEEAYLFCRASQIYFQQQKYDKALEMAEEGLQCDPQDADCLLNCGAALIELNRLEEADEFLTSALAIAPESYLAHLNKGAINLRKNNQPEAFKFYRESLRLNPNSEKAREGVVESLKAKNPLYHQMLKFSVWCRKLPRWLVVCFILLLIVPGIRFVVLGILAIYGIADYAFMLLLQTDPESRKFLNPPQKIQQNKSVPRYAKLAMAVGFAFLAFATMAGYHNGSVKREKEAAREQESLKPPPAFKDYPTYMTYIQKRIKSNWFPQHLKKSNKAIVAFDVKRNGTVKNIKLVQSCGDKFTDQAAVQSVKSSAPLPPLPPSTTDPEVSVNFDFQYNYMQPQN